LKKLRSNRKHFVSMKTAAEQVIGREGETATFLSRRPFNSNGLGGGFAPRQFGRSAASGIVIT
jgi:hypothetical protein